VSFEGSLIARSLDVIECRRYPKICQRIVRRFTVAARFTKATEDKSEGMACDFRVFPCSFKAETERTFQADDFAAVVFETHASGMEHRWWVERDEFGIRAAIMSGFYGGGFAGDE
jgi:hypothetical protein